MTLMTHNHTTRLLVLLGLVGMSLLAALAFAAVTAQLDTSKKVIVLGFDGHRLPSSRSQMIAEGRLPNFERLASRKARSAPLGTSIPPQSPVAWSNFITGTGSPAATESSTSSTAIPKTHLPLPVHEQGRGGREVVQDRQVPVSTGLAGENRWSSCATAKRSGTKLGRRRASRPRSSGCRRNFPPSGTATRELSGMGTPDIVGTYGTFSYFTTDDSRFRGGCFHTSYRETATARPHGPALTTEPGWHSSKISGPNRAPLPSSSSGSSS